MSTYHYASNIIIGSGLGGWGTADIAAHEKQTIAALDQIVSKSWVGYGLIMEIRELKGNVVINPATNKICNAVTIPPRWISKTDVEIVFTPSHFGIVSCNGPGFQPDEFLLHELVHAYRRLKNRNLKIESVKVDGFRYTDNEEFAAVVYANTYMSARNRGLLRKDHFDNTPLAANLSTSHGFLYLVKKHAFYIHNLIREDYHFCQTYVRRDAGVFNPINYFLTNSGEVTKLIEWPQPMKPDP